MTGEDTDTPCGFDGTGGAPWVECYVRTKRSPALLKQIESISDRIERLADEGVVEGYSLTQWPPRQQAPAESESAETTRREIIGEFEAWAHSNGYSLRPAFQRERALPSTPGYDEPQEYIRVPQVALALYRPDTDQLTGVLPCREREPPDDGEVYTVTQWIRAVEAFADSGWPSNERKDILSVI